MLALTGCWFYGTRGQCRQIVQTSYAGMRVPILVSLQCAYCHLRSGSRRSRFRLALPGASLVFSSCVQSGLILAFWHAFPRLARAATSVRQFRSFEIRQVGRDLPSCQARPIPPRQAWALSLKIFEALRFLPAEPPSNNTGTYGKAKPL